MKNGSPFPSANADLGYLPMTAIQSEGAFADEGTRAAVKGLVELPDIG